VHLQFEFTIIDKAIAALSSTETSTEERKVVVELLQKLKL
jgi:hypothetical protein